MLKSSSHTISRTQSEEGHTKPPYQITYVVWFENIKADVDKCFNLLGVSSARTSQDLNLFCHCNKTDEETADSHIQIIRPCEARV